MILVLYTESPLSVNENVLDKIESTGGTNLDIGYAAPIQILDSDQQTRLLPVISLHPLQRLLYSFQMAKANKYVW